MRSYNGYTTAAVPGMSRAASTAPVRTGMRKTHAGPGVNIYLANGKYTIELAVPGLNRDDVEIRLKDGRLYVSANRGDAEQGTVIRREFDHTKFERQFRLGDNADVDAVEAKLENGILEIVIPQKKNRKIEIL